MKCSCSRVYLWLGFRGERLRRRLEVGSEDSEDSEMDGDSEAAEDNGLKIDELEVELDSSSSLESFRIDVIDILPAAFCIRLSLHSAATMLADLSASPYELEYIFCSGNIIVQIVNQGRK